MEIMEYKDILATRSKKVLIELISGLIACFILHWLMLNFQWYNSLPTLQWTDAKGRASSAHYGLVGIFVCAFFGLLFGSFMFERAVGNVRIKLCSKCGLSRVIKKSTVLMTNEQKENLYKKSPQLFSEIHLNLQMAMKSNVTANYLQCGKCGHQRECKLRTDAHVPDDFHDGSGSSHTF